MKLPSGIIGIVDGEHILVNSKLTNESRDWYEQVLLSQLENGCDCVVSKDGDSLRIIKMKKPGA